MTIFYLSLGINTINYVFQFNLKKKFSWLFVIYRSNYYTRVLFSGGSRGGALGATAPTLNEKSSLFPITNDYFSHSAPPLKKVPDSTAPTFRTPSENFLDPPLILMSRKYEKLRKKILILHELHKNWSSSDIANELMNSPIW